jgi:hypothetical protein
LLPSVDLHINGGGGLAHHMGHFEPRREASLGCFGGPAVGFWAWSPCRGQMAAGRFFLARQFRSGVNITIFHLCFEFQKLFCFVFSCFYDVFHLS